MEGGISGRESSKCKGPEVRACVDIWLICEAAGRPVELELGVRRNR